MDYDIFFVYIVTIFSLVYIILMLIIYFGKYTFVCLSMTLFPTTIVSNTARKFLNGMK